MGLTVCGEVQPNYFQDYLLTGYRNVTSTVQRPLSSSLRVATFGLFAFFSLKPAGRIHVLFTSPGWNVVQPVGDEDGDEPR